MTADQPPVTLRVRRVDPDSDARLDLGTVTYGERGHLTVLAARPAFAAYLAQVVAATNARAELSLKVPPPEGGRPNSIYTLTVARTAPDLLDVMRQYFQQKYDLVLADAAE